MATDAELAHEVNRLNRRIQAIQNRLVAERERLGVKPGESLWMAMFGVPFPFAEEQQQ